MHEDWLQKHVTVATAESAHMVQIDCLGPDPVAFGFQNERWRALLSQMREDDELWKFCSPQESWEHLHGREGIALVRNGKVVEAIVTVLS